MERLIYSKYSNERSRRFSLRTDILEQDGIRSVRKVPLYKEGREHVEKLSVWCRRLEKIFEKSPFVCNKCTADGDGAVLQYVSGETLEEHLDRLLKQGETEKAQELLNGYLEEVEKIYKGTHFVKTEEFRNVFGDVSLSEDLECGEISDIDMVCQNIVLTNPPVVLDYEWTFDFPVPAKFILYRIIHYYIRLNGMREVFSERKLYDKWGIDENLLKEFEKMEISFQNYITEGHVPMRDMFADITPGAVWVRERYQQAQAENIRLRQKLEKQDQLLHEIKNTKVWRLYRKYRKLVERK